jgi:hypothetical protein
MNTYPFAGEIKMEKVIKDGKEVIEWEPVPLQSDRFSIDFVTGNVSIGTPNQEHVDETAKGEREWVGLTDEERYLGDAKSEEEIEYARAIEAKLKEKNT